MHGLNWVGSGLIHCTDLIRIHVAGRPAHAPAVTIASLLFLISILCTARLGMRLTASAPAQHIYYVYIYKIYMAARTRLCNPIALHDRGAVYSYSTVLLDLGTVCCSQKGGSLETQRTPLVMGLY